MVIVQQTQISPCSYRTNSYLRMKIPSSCLDLHGMIHPNQHTKSLPWKVQLNICNHSHHGAKEELVHGTIGQQKPIIKHLCILDTKKYHICKSITFLQKFCIIPKFQPCDYMTKIAEDWLVEIIRLNKWNARESSKHLQTLDNRADAAITMVNAPLVENGCLCCVGSNTNKTETFRIPPRCWKYPQKFQSLGQTICISVHDFFIFVHSIHSYCHRDLKMP